MEVTVEAPARKSKRLTSVVWNHFERIRKADVCYAVCVHCKKKLSGSSNSGTTHLRNHLLRCLKRSDNYDVSSILSAKRKKKDNTVSLASLTYNDVGRIDEVITPINSYRAELDPRKEELPQAINLGSVRFDQERSRLDLARMIMWHGYPLAMADHVGFRIFARNLQPLFEVSGNGTTEIDCMTIYGKEKQKLYELVHNLHSRISVAVGMWISPENERCVSLTAYFVDEEWKLQKRMINFVTLDPTFTDDVLSEVIIKCLTDWSIDRKMLSMTFDDCLVFDDVAFKIKDWLSQNKALVKNGELFDLRCASQVLKSIVEDVLEAAKDLTDKIRESIGYIRTSQAVLARFDGFVQKARITNQMSLVLDCPTQWNSTYSMLEAATVYKNAFSLLQENDPSYTVVITDREWEWADTVSSYLKLIGEIMNVFIAIKTPTANIYFPELCDIHIQLIEWCQSQDPFLRSIAMNMKTKFDTYWRKCSPAVAIAAVLDPRFKMKLVDYYYPKIYGADSMVYVKEVSDGIRDLFSEYVVSSSALYQDPSTSDGYALTFGNGTRDRLRGFDKFLHETSGSQSMVSDLDKYLDEPVFPRDPDFNILNWWKVQTPRYPILSMMARDVLGIPVATLGEDLVFSNRGRVLDQQQSSLNPDIREALICGQDWLRVESEENIAALSHYMVT